MTTSSSTLLNSRELLATTKNINFLSKQEWIAEWQKRLPDNYFLYLYKDENGFYSNRVKFSISQNGEQSEYYYLEIGHDRGILSCSKVNKSSIFYLSPEKIESIQSEIGFHSPMRICGFKKGDVPDNILNELLNSFRTLFRETPCISATPSKKIEAVYYDLDFQNEKMYRTVLSLFEEKYKAINYCEIEAGNTIEFPDGKTFVNDQYGNAQLILNGPSA